MTLFGAVGSASALSDQLILGLNDFRNGATSPANGTLGTTPTVPTKLFAATNELIAVGFDGLWLGAPPNLLFVPDRDDDDKADTGDIEVKLTGWGIRDRHETLNSFHWGPDGWLYGLQGFATPSKVGKPKGDGRLFKHREEFPRNIELEGGGTDTRPAERPR